MLDFLPFGIDRLELFLLCLFRITGLVMLAPLFGDNSVPVMIRVGFSILLSMIAVLVLPPDAAPITGSDAELLLLVARELFIGLIIGFGFRILVYGIQSAGWLIGYQIGFSIANIIDPTTGSEQSIVAQFWFMIGALIFLCLNGHHLIIQAIIQSYELLPLGRQIALDSWHQITQLSATVFVLALKLSAPIVVSLFLIDVALATISRLIPTMNVFVIGFVVKAGAGMIVMAISLPIFAYVLEKTTMYLDREVLTLIAGMGRS
jgi:flagellar biosynthetic protein FliR